MQLCAGECWQFAVCLYINDPSITPSPLRLSNERLRLVSRYTRVRWRLFASSPYTRVTWTNRRGLGGSEPGRLSSVYTLVGWRFERSWLSRSTRRTTWSSISQSPSNSTTTSSYRCWTCIEYITKRWREAGARPKVRDRFSATGRWSANEFSLHAELSRCTLHFTSLVN